LQEQRTPREVAQEKRQSSCATARKFEQRTSQAKHVCVEISRGAARIQVSQQTSIDKAVSESLRSSISINVPTVDSSLQKNVLLWHETICILDKNEYSEEEFMQLVTIPCSRLLPNKRGGQMHAQLACIARIGTDLVRRVSAAAVESLGPQRLNTKKKNKG
jgi:hypothetical protein